MKSENNLTDIISGFYSKTYGTKKPRGGYTEKNASFDRYNLINISRKSESLPPAIRKALNYLYPVKFLQETKPATEYDKLVRRLSEFSLESSQVNPAIKSMKLKKRVLDDYNQYRSPNRLKNNSQEYISCINYNGQAESEYMMTKEGVDEYKNLYKLTLQDSGLALDRIRPNKSFIKRNK